jgi:glycerol-3-phosphate dehydrogenase (NAD(P)+)
MYGENYIKGIPMTKLAEGVDTSKAMVKLAEIYKVDLPICQAVYDVVVEGKDPKSVMDNLFDRENKFEF